MLLNNVEKRDPYGEDFHRASDEEVLSTLNLNTFPMVFMTRFLGPAMKNRVKANGETSAIINMTSTYADYPQKGLPVFSSSKSFCDVFSQNLWFENQEMDILTVKHMPSKSFESPLGV